jgi:DNA-directed RNA polymerase subunit RPC12/RpoP
MPDRTDTDDMKVIFVCSKCGATIDPETANYEESDDSVQCPVCGNWE